MSRIIRNIWDGILDAGIIIVPSLLFLVTIYMAAAALTGSDTTKWTQIDNDRSCYLLVSQQKNAWLTPGKTDPKVRTIYCRKSD